MATEDRNPTLPAKTADESPADRRRARVRDDILDAAERVFAGEGADGLSIRRLAEEVDYSPAAIYKYFESKDALVFELKQAFFERLNARMEEIANSGQPFLDKAAACLRAYVETARDRPHHYAAAFNGIANHNTDDDLSPSKQVPLMTTPAGVAFTSLLNMVCEGADLGHFRLPTDALTAAKSIWASCHGLAMLISHFPGYPTFDPDGDRGAQDNFITVHTHMLMSALGAKTSNVSAE